MSASGAPSCLLASCDMRPGVPLCALLGTIPETTCRSGTVLVGGLVFHLLLKGTWDFAPDFADKKCMSFLEKKRIPISSKHVFK